MDLIGLANDIAVAAFNIDFGRKGFAIKGKAEEGRLSYETGIAEAMAAFQEAQSTHDPETIMLAEYTFLVQELEFCVKTDINSISSLNQAILSFNDAFLALKAVNEKIHYIAVDDSIPHNKKYRVSGLPKDSFHIACVSHRTRLQNILRAPGIDPIEKELLKQRFINLSAAQNGYIDKQKIALGNI